MLVREASCYYFGLTSTCARPNHGVCTGFVGRYEGLAFPIRALRLRFQPSLLPVLFS